MSGAFAFYMFYICGYISPPTRFLKRILPVKRLAHSRAWEFLEEGMILISRYSASQNTYTDKGRHSKIKDRLPSFIFIFINM